MQLAGTDNKRRAIRRLLSMAPRMGLGLDPGRGVVLVLVLVLVLVQTAQEQEQAQERGAATSKLSKASLYSGRLVSR